MKKFLLLQIFFFLTVNAGMCQNSFGPEFGHLWINVNGGTYQFDDVTVITNSGPDAADGFGGLFFQYQISERFSIHNKLNYSRRFVSHSIFNNQTDCTFCPEVKVRSVRVNSFGLELLPQFNIIKKQKIAINIFAGINATVNSVPEIEPIVFPNLPQVSEVANNLDQAIKPMTLGLAYGVSIELWRLVIWGKFLPSVQYSDKVELKGQNFNFDNSWSFTSISLGYKLYGFKPKNTSKLQ